MVMNRVLLRLLLHRLILRRRRRSDFVLRGLAKKSVTK
jgi:hypothetical protein